MTDYFEVDLKSNTVEYNIPLDEADADDVPEAQTLVDGELIMYYLNISDDDDDENDDNG